MTALKLLTLFEKADCATRLEEMRVAVVQLFQSHSKYFGYSPLFQLQYIRQFKLKVIQSGCFVLRPFIPVKKFFILLEGQLQLRATNIWINYSAYSTKTSKSIDLRLKPGKIPVSTYLFSQCLQEGVYIKTNFALQAKGRCKLALLEGPSLRQAIFSRKAKIIQASRHSLLSRLQDAVHLHKEQQILKRLVLVVSNEGQILIPFFKQLKGLHFVVRGVFKTLGDCGQQYFKEGQLIGLDEFIYQQTPTYEVRCVCAYGQCLLVPRQVVGKMINLQRVKRESLSQTHSESQWLYLFDTSLKKCIPPTRQKAASRFKINQIQRKFFNLQLVQFQQPKPRFPKERIQRTVSAFSRALNIKTFTKKCIPNQTPRLSSHEAVSRSLFNIKRLFAIS